MLKFLILADSNANPRSFPENEMIQLNETYPYIIRDNFSEAIFWQLSFGNISTEELLNQAISYLTHWSPDIIIIQSGVADCRPEAFTELQKTIINHFSGPLFRYLRKYMYHPGLIRKRQIYRVSRRNFRKTLKKFKMIFNKSKIFVLEISVPPAYENLRPGMNKRLDEYNMIIKDIYGEDMIVVHKKLIEANGYCSDNLHFNVQGHKVIADEITNKIVSYLGN